MDWDQIIVDIQPDGTVTLLDFFKEFLGIDDTAQDTELTQALNITGPIIETYLDRVLPKQEVTEQFPHHFGTVVLHEPKVDASADVTVTLNGNEQSSYSLYLQRGGYAHLTRQGTRPDMPMDWRTYDQVDVTYMAGYDPLPVDVANAIIYTASDVFKSMGAGTVPGGASGEIKSMSIYDVGSISYDVGGSSSGGSSDAFGSAGIIPSSAAQILTRYKRMFA